MIILAHIQVNACEALASQRLNSDVQKRIAPEIRQLIHGNVSQTQKMHGLTVPFMAGWRQRRYVAVVETQNDDSSVWNPGQSSERLGLD